MKNSFKKSFMYMMLLLALTFSTLGVTPALADDGVTPPTDAPVVVEEPVVDAPVADAPAAEEPVADAPAVDAPAEQPAAEEPAAEAATVAEILEAAPEGTEVVVLDESGEALPLASTEAAEVLASGDPYFWDNGVGGYVGYTTTTCPAEVDSANCHVVTVNPIQAAVNAFAASSSATGEIFVAAGTYTENVSINTKNGANLANLSGLIGAGSGSTTINGTLQVYLPNAFTLSGFTFNDFVYVKTAGDVAMSDVVVDGSYMYVYSSGNVELNGVTASQSPREGANVYAGGNISIWDSHFDNNGEEGLVAVATNDANNVIMLDGVTASGNLWYGAFIATESSENGDISIWDSHFDDNGRSGLNVYIEGGGNVMLDGVTASGNLLDGANIVSEKGDISIFDSTFNANGSSGVYAHSKSGNVMLDGVTAVGNNGAGATLLSPAMVEVFCSEFSGSNDGVNAHTPDLYLNGVAFSGNPNLDYFNDGNVWVSDFDCSKVVNVNTPEKPANDDGTDKKEHTPAPLYIVVEHVQGQLPAALGDGFKFGSALKVELTEEGKDVTDLAITLSFPVPDGMQDAKLAVMFWNGSAWEEVSGGSVVGGFYVITVTQPGVYVLAG